MLGTLNPVLPRANRDQGTQHFFTIPDSQGTREGDDEIAHIKTQLHKKSGLTRKYLTVMHQSGLL